MLRESLAESYQSKRAVPGVRARGAGRGVVVELRILGPLSLRGRRGAAREQIAIQPKRLALLAYLALAPRTGLVRRDALLALLWPERDARHARNALSQAMHGLRRDLGPDVVRIQGNEEVGLSPARFWCDAAAFRQALERGDLSTAVRLYEGDFLEAFHVSGAPAFERWLDVERAQLRRAAFRSALRLADREELAHRPVHASRWLRRAVDIAPTEETALRRLVTTLDALGNRAGALLAYEETAARLRGEYELEPSAETRELVALVRVRHAADTRGPVGPRLQAVPARDGAAVRSVAVLPMRDLDPEPDGAYFGVGLTETLTTELGKVAALRVLSARSMLHYARSQQPLAEIGAELGVDALVHGSVRRADGSVRIAARLIRVTPEEQLWSATYERPLQDLGGVIGEVARAIIDELAVGVSAEERSRLKDPRPVDPAAYRAFLRGRYLSAMLPQTREAVASFERAIAIDAAYAPAYAGIAICVANLAVFAHMPPAEAAAKLETCARRAIELDDALSDPHVALGTGRLIFARDWPGAERAFRRAVALNPSSAYARAYLAIYLSTMGWTEAGVAEAARAAELDPLDPWTGFVHGFALYRARRYDASLERLWALLELYPHHALAHLFVAENELKRGRLAQAVSSCRAALALLPQDQLLVGIGACVLALAGKRRQARRLVRGLEARAGHEYINPAFVAAAYAGLGERDTAFAYWERMYTEGAPSAFLLRTDPLFDCVRSDARLQDLLRRLAFPEVPAD